ncbi:MAG: aldehyde dehydrogenase (NADP(+)) [Sphingobacteriales bacterium]|nr:MAG: aldehyde dehydrogenase (NADP(+)) [Sphingobacteriales bacterium]
MTLTGQHLIAGQFAATGNITFVGYNPAQETDLTTHFFEATAEEVNSACEAASAAFAPYKKLSDADRALFLETIAIEIVNLGDALLETAMLESGLPLARLTGERGRTAGQLNAFAKMLREGSWVNAIIDTAQPDRQPLPKVDLRQMQIPLGAVAVFGASNFPLAFSVAGGDTASALAAGCPVVFKAHPAHPGTCEMVAAAIAKAMEICNIPLGTFNLLQGSSHNLGTALVQHPAIKAVGFTGSFAGGKALYNLAAARPQPIPVYAEMGSVNPVFFLPGILKEKGAALAKGFASSITMGVGQFCTNPGMFVALADDNSTNFINDTKTELSAITVGAMLTAGIKNNYLKGVTHLNKATGVTSSTQANATEVKPHLFITDVAAIEKNPLIVEEVFGPCSVGVVAQNKAELLKLASDLEGHLTATVHGTAADLAEYAELLDILQDKAGRVVINGFPTGVEVTHAMVHGGPFPATTDSRSTSVGTTAIYRFTRPVCFQDFPDTLLPDALKTGNPLKINRLINSVHSNA